MFRMSLLELPEEVICTILRYLDATSLYLLGRTCTSLDEIIKNHITLWRRIDARRSPNDHHKTSYCLERCYNEENSWTHTLLLRGDSPSDSLKFGTFFEKINTFGKLTVLACENQTIDGTTYNVMAFPPQLQELSLKKTVVVHSLEFFKGSGEYFKSLRVLILDGCDWLTSAAFMPISKYASLEILSVYKCRNVENSIAYLSLSGQGFKALKVFDARLSPLGNTLIRAIYRMQSLLAIYLQNEDVTYKLDYFKRKLQILQGHPTRDFFIKDEEFDHTKEENLIEDNGMLDDDGLIDYLSIHSEAKDTKYPQSVLYLDPYNRCTCGFDDTEKNTPNPGDSDDDDDDKDDFNGDTPLNQLTKKINKLRGLIKRNVVRRGLNNHHPSNPACTLISLFGAHNDSTYVNHKICMNIVGSSRGQFGLDNENSNFRFNYCFFNDGNNTEEENRSGISLRIQGGGAFFRSSDAEPVAGPSGLNSESEEPPAKKPKTEDAEPEVERPPTPYPGIEINAVNERNALYRIFFLDSPVVHIENINETNKNIKVPLRRLSLRGYKKITNAALRYINDLDLDLLDLTYTSVTFEGVRSYLMSHPLCRVVHERFCTCLPNLHF